MYERLLTSERELLTTDRAKAKLERAGAEAEMRFVRSQLMQTRGRLHCRGLAEEFESDLSLKFQWEIKKEERRQGKEISRRDMIDLVVKINPQDERVDCLVRAAKRSGKKEG